MTAADALVQTMLTPRLRRATALDAAAIHAQVQATYAPLAGKLPESTVFTEVLTQVFAALECGPIWVIEAEGQVIASVRAAISHDCQKTPAAWVEVHRLAVLPDHTRCGFGRRLMHAVEAYALAEILPPLPARVELEVRAAQPESEAFYRALGYENLGASIRLSTGAPRSFRMQKTVARAEGDHFTSAQT
jgi:GNAT superfamily N-acetyltransferase